MEALTNNRTECELWLALARTPALQPLKCATLICERGGVAALFESVSSLDISPQARRYLEAPDWSSVEQDLLWLEKTNHSLVTLVDVCYPKRLREIPDPPAVLFVSGRVETLSQPQLAMVGSRHATPAAVETAYEFAHALAGMGITVTSGLALGIDAASHRGALASAGYTLAVLGCGPDQVYPRTHAELSREIGASAGALVTEFPTGVLPIAHHFPRRNRIISGLSVGVLVVEAAKQSGSLIIARLASEQGREVLAMPGSIHNPLARGCHGLIRQGAKLVETVDDILEEIGPLLSLPEHAPPAQAEKDDRFEADFGADYIFLLDNVDYHPTPVDLLVERTRLTPQVVSSMLLQLELGGYVSSISGGRYTRIARNSK